MTSTWFDDAVAQQERALSRLENEIRMVEDVHDRSDNLLYILYAVQDHCEEIAVRIDELMQGCRVLGAAGRSMAGDGGSCIAM
jgi:hypothetical protein